MDELDRKILEILEENARTPFLKMGKMLGVSEATIRHRVKRLIKEGVIKKFTIIKGEKKMLTAFVLVQVAPSHPVYKMAARIRKMKNVKEVYEISGETDIICKLQAHSTSEINEVIDKIRGLEGVERTTTYFVLKT